MMYPSVSGTGRTNRSVDCDEEIEGGKTFPADVEGRRLSQTNSTVGETSKDKTTCESKISPKETEAIPFLPSLEKVTGLDMTANTFADSESLTSGIVNNKNYSVSFVEVGFNAAEGATKKKKKAKKVVKKLAATGAKLDKHDIAVVPDRGFEGASLRKIMSSRASVQPPISETQASSTFSFTPDGFDPDDFVNAIPLRSSNSRKHRPSKKYRDHYSYFRDMSNSQKYDMMLESDEIETYPGDCYSFIAIYSPLKKPQYFCFGLMVWMFQVAFLTYMIWSKLEPELEVDNPSKNFIGSFMPSKVSALVQATQITAVLCYLVFADSSLRDCAMAVEQWPRLDRAKVDDHVLLAMCSCVLRFIQGSMAIIASFLLIMTSDDVVDIILNFAAVNFISTLDEMAFELARWGKYGPALEKVARTVEERPLPYCLHRKYHHERYKFTIIPIAIVLIIFCIMISIWQTNDQYWLTQTVRVQFKETSELNIYSGFYNLDPNHEYNKRSNYNSDIQNAKKATFGYCKKRHEWVLFKNEHGDEEMNDDWSSDPCDANPETEIAHSASTESFDVYTSEGDAWFSRTGTPLDVYFFESEELGVDLQENCGSFLANGICDVAFNKLEYGYDGGDCCAPTCFSANCGQGGAIGAFGSNEITSGVGYHDCIDPDMVPVTIVLNDISSSRDPNMLEVTDEQVEKYNRERGVDFWNEIPSTPYLNVYCDDISTLSLYIDSSMAQEPETFFVQDGARCKITISNTTDSTNNWDNVPIWWVNYTIYHGSDTANEIVSGYSRDESTITFKKVQQCHFDLLKDHVDISSAYTDSSDLTEALSWIVNDDSGYSDCDYPFVVERFALASLNFAALETSPLTPDGNGNLTENELHQEYLWINSRKQCQWDNIVCNEGTVESLKIKDKYNMTGFISTSIGLLTGLKRLEYTTCGLHGSIPTEVGILTKLTGLELDYNELVGTIPTQLGLLTSIVELDLDKNMLTGTIPSELGQMVEATEFDLEGNKLSGSIPNEIFALPKIRALQCNDNILTGSIPIKIRSMANLNDLSLANNSMHGTIPSEISQLSNLGILNLENNNFKGPIPTEIGLMTSLHTIDLRGNSFTGQIPLQMAFLSKLRHIRIEGNNFTGSIPIQISLLKNLVTLTHDENLEGSIPSHIKTNEPCRVCEGNSYQSLFLTNGDQIFHEVGVSGIQRYDCTTLLLHKDDFPNHLLSADACKFLGENCVVCEDTSVTTQDASTLNERSFLGS